MHKLYFTISQIAYLGSGAAVFFVGKDHPEVPIVVLLIAIWLMLGAIYYKSGESK